MRIQRQVVVGLAVLMITPRLWADDQDAAKKIIKNGLIGAGVGAVAAAASGGKAGKGALIGAGTSVVGGAVVDLLTGGQQPQEPPAQAYPQPPPTYTPNAYPAPAAAYPAPTAAYPAGGSGDYQTGYQKGYQEGFQQGFQQGLQQGRSGR